MKKIIICLFCLFCHYKIFSQTPDSTKNLQLSVIEDMLNLKIKGLKKEQIYSATKALEKYIESPVAATVINRQMIDQTGVINIPEALRLASGIWVSQKTNGNYGVYLRGNYTPGKGMLQDSKNNHILLVIDHVPQYDYLFSGIIWEALPISLNDVERIEIVRTPSTIYFGNAAITGVIHIFTNAVQDNDLKLTVNSQAGISAFNLQGDNKDLSYSHQAALSFGISDKLHFRLSGNYHFLNRFQDEYYLLPKNRYIISDSLLFYKQNASETNLNTKLGQERLGVNTGIFYHPSEKVTITTQLSFQNSRVQTIHSDDTLALAQRQSTGYGINVNAYAHGFHLNTSYDVRERNYALGYDGNNFLSNQLQASLNYRFSYKAFQFQPGAGFLQADYTELKVTNDSLTTFTNYYAFLKADVHPLPNWRVLASVRGDIFEQIKKPYLSYQVSSSYKMANHLIRGSYTYNEAVPLIRQTSQNIRHTLLPQLSANTTQAVELGWNARIIAKIRASLEIFHNRNAFNYSSFNGDGNQPTKNKLFELTQAGASAQVNVWLNKLQVGGFITFQRSGQTFNELIQQRFQSTPQFYGGAQINYTGLLGRLNLNAQAYFYENYQLETQYRTLTLPAKTLLNVKVSYKIWKENSIFLNVRNALNSSSREFIFADRIGALYLAGLKIII